MDQQPKSCIIKTGPEYTQLLIEYKLFLKGRINGKHNGVAFSFQNKPAYEWAISFSKKMWQENMKKKKKKNHVWKKSNVEEVASGKSQNAQ